MLNKNAKKSKKPVISTLPGNGGVQIAAENRIDITTQNPPLATAYRFESGHRHQKRDIREDVSFFVADRRVYTNLTKITNISITA